MNPCAKPRREAFFKAYRSEPENEDREIVKNRWFLTKGDYKNRRFLLGYVESIEMSFD